MNNKPRPSPRIINKHMCKPDYHIIPSRLINDITNYKYKSSFDELCRHRMQSLIRNAPEHLPKVRRTLSMRHLNTNSKDEQDISTINSILRINSNNDFNKKVQRNSKKSLSLDNIHFKYNNNESPKININTGSNKNQARKQLNLHHIHENKLRILRIELSILIYIIRESSDYYGMKLLRNECINIVKRFSNKIQSLTKDISYYDIIKLIKILNEILYDIERNIILFYVYFKDLLLVLQKLDIYLGLGILKNNLHDLVLHVEENLQKVYFNNRQEVQLLIQNIMVTQNVSNSDNSLKQFMQYSNLLNNIKFELLTITKYHWSYRLKRLLNIHHVTFQLDKFNSRFLLVFIPYHNYTISSNVLYKKKSYDIDDDEKNKLDKHLPTFKLLHIKVQKAFLECPIPIQFGSCIVQLPDSSIHEIRSLPNTNYVRASSRRQCTNYNLTKQLSPSLCRKLSINGSGEMKEKEKENRKIDDDFPYIHHPIKSYNECNNKFKTYNSFLDLFHKNGKLSVH